MATGIKVALCYHIVRHNLPEQAPHITPQIKAIHIEVDSMAPHNHDEQIGRVFSAKTKNFPAGIKMRLVARSPILQ